MAPGPRILVAGGGLAGLSAVAHLAAEPGFRGSVHVVDDGARRTGHGDWAFWSDRPGLLDPAASARFDRLRVCAGGHERIVGLGGYTYRQVRDTDLAATVRGIVGDDPRFTTSRGRVESIGCGARGAVAVVDGRAEGADVVLDGVLGPGPAAVPDARLVFRGWRVRTAVPVFDPAVPTLFDFRTPQGPGASFVYVLPRGPREALVEHTTFAPAGGPVPGPAAQDDGLAGYLHDVLGAGDGYTVEGVEAATLPLSAAPVARRRGPVLAIGVAGGLLKASTGYAYSRIQRDSAAIARSLAVHGHPFDLPRPHPRHRRYDGALLGAVAARPALLEEAFDALFRGPQVDDVLRFLDEDTGLAAEARLFARLPAAPLVAALTRRRH